MFHFTESFFFRPNQDIKGLLPILAGLALVIVLVFCAGLVFYIVRRYRLKKMDRKRFHILAKRFALTRSEESFLLRLAKRMNMKPLTRIMNEPERFEKSVRRVEEKGRRQERRMVRSTREKLFGKTLEPGETLRSTHELAPGIRLFLDYVDFKQTALWGHLVDVDRDGLIVVIPSYHEIHVPLRPETRLEVTAYLPNRDPIIFRTWVKSVIPGPRKMVILGHSSFVVEMAKNKKVYVTAPIPQKSINGALSPRFEEKNFYGHKYASV